MHRLSEYTLISFKCQSIRSKVHCTNKTLHNESLKNVTVQLGPRVTCAKNMTLIVCLAIFVLVVFRLLHSHNYFILTG